MLVQEGRADPNAREHCGRTALFWLPYFQVPVQICDDALDLLVSLGADVNARDDWGRALIFDYARGGSLPSLLRLLGHCVANPNVRAQDGQTPLLCCSLERDGEVFMELLRRSSIATRRSIDEHGRSALDRLVSSFREPRKPWHAAAMAELLRSGVPSRPESARVLLPIAAFVMRQQETDLEIFRSGRLLWDWRGHEAMVHLALQMQETRFYERRVAECDAEVRRLEAELRARQRRGGKRG